MKANTATRNNRRVKINISGEIFETYQKTLRRFPDTVLGQLHPGSRHFCPFSDQYFFDRSRKCFEAILFFYQSNGILSCPEDIPLEIFEEECRFFRVPHDSIKKMKLKEGIVLELEELVDKNPQAGETHYPSCLLKLWNIVEKPETSSLATYFMVFSTTMVVLSVVATCVETIPSLHKKNIHQTHRKTMNLDFWLTTELALNCWFLFELLLRFATAPRKLKFLQSYMNWLDALVVFPYFVTLMSSPAQVNSIGFLRILRFVRIMRLFRLSKHSKRIKIIAVIFASCKEELKMLSLCITVLIVLAGSVIYYSEGHNFPSIPESFWWAVQTITTVGYGDVVPVTIGGRLFAGCFMLFGATTISLPVLTVVTKLVTIYAKNTEDTDDPISKFKNQSMKKAGRLRKR